MYVLHTERWIKESFLARQNTQAASFHKQIFLTTVKRDRDMSRNPNQQTRAAVASAAVVLMLSLGACSKFQSAEKFVADAKNYEQKGDHKAAIIQLKNALQKDPKNVDARFMLGSIYANGGDPLSAENELRKAINLGLSKDKALPALATALLLQGQYQKVLDETKPDPGKKLSAPMWVLRGDAFLGLEKTPDAKLAFEEALKQQPDYADALIGLSKHAYAERDLDAANKYADLATGKNSKSTEAWLFKGDLLRVQGKSDAALAAYGEALKLQPDNANALIARANLEVGLKKFNEAQADINNAKKARPGGIAALYVQALLDYTQGKNKEALDSLQQLLRSSPQYMPAVLLNGVVQFSLGATQQAETYLAKYLESNPGNVYAQKMLAASLMKNGQPDKALKVLDAALEDDKIKDSQLFALAGDAATRTKNFSKANEYFEKASALAPQNAEYHTALGMSKLSLGESDRAVAELEKANALDDKSASPKAGVLLVMTHLRRQEFDKAMATVKQLEKEQPDNPMLQNLEGGIYLGKKDRTNARASFEKAVQQQATYLPAVTNLARLDVQDNKIDVAIQRFTALLDKDKKNLPAELALANLAQVQGKQDETRKWLERAYEEHPDATQASQPLVSNYLRTGEKQKALVLAKKLQASNPKSPELLDMLAQTQAAADDKNGAIESFSRLAALLPQSPAAQFRVASAYMAAGKENEAYDALKTAVRLDPNFLDAQIAISGIEAKRGNFEHALQMAKEVQKQNEKAAGGYIMEGDIRMYQKKPELAVKSFEKALSLDKRGPVMVKLHFAMLQDGKAKDADAKLAQWLKDNPSDNSTRMYQALYLLNSPKSRQPAIEQFLTILKYDPLNVIALNNVAWAYDQDNNPHAIEYAEKAYRLAADNPSVLDTYGWLLTLKGDVTRGLPMLQRANNLMPNASEVRYHMAYALAKSGEKDKARKELEQITAGKDFPKMEEAKNLLKQVSS